MRKILLLTTALLASLVVAQADPAAADGCASGRPPAFFVATVYDSSRRADFLADAGHFETVRAALAATYCMPASNARILAFDNGYTRDGVTYEAATEVATKRAIAEIGSAARATPGSTFFFMLSSHGIFYASAPCESGGRRGGSLAALRSSGPGENGDFTDCELGEALNTHVGPDVRTFVHVDCSFCGGFSDSLTAVSGTVPDGSLPVPSGILGPNRVVMTGCAVTTECTGDGDRGGRMLRHMIGRFSVAACDGWTAPRFPEVQGIDLPERSKARDGRCTASELHFAAVDSAYEELDAIGIQQQYRIKYGFPTLAEDIQLL